MSESVMATEANDNGRCIAIQRVKGSNEVVSIPIEDDNTVLLSSVRKYFPTATSLIYANENNSFRGMRIVDGIIYEPTDGDGWNDKVFRCAFPKSEDQQDSSSNTNIIHDLIVLGLTYNTDEQMLRDHFSNFGELVVCNVKSDPSTLTSRGFGFIRFSSYEAQSSCLNSQEHTIDGRKVEVRVPNSQIEGQRQDIARKIYVGNIDQERHTTEVLRSFFSNYGNVTDVYFSRPFRPFAFVAFDDPAVCTNLIGKSFEIAGVKVTVNPAVPKQKTSRMQSASEMRSPRSPPMMNGRFRGGNNNGYHDYSNGNKAYMNGSAPNGHYFCNANADSSNNNNTYRNNQSQNYCNSRRCNTQYSASHNSLAAQRVAGQPISSFNQSATYPTSNHNGIAPEYAQMAPFYPTYNAGHYAPNATGPGVDMATQAAMAGAYSHDQSLNEQYLALLSHPHLLNNFFNMCHLGNTTPNHGAGTSATIPSQAMVPQPTPLLPNSAPAITPLLGNGHQSAPSHTYPGHHGYLQPDQSGSFASGLYNPLTPSHHAPMNGHHFFNGPAVTTNGIIIGNGHNFTPNNYATIYQENYVPPTQEMTNGTLPTTTAILSPLKISNGIDHSNTSAVAPLSADNSSDLVSNGNRINGNPKTSLRNAKSASCTPIKATSSSAAVVTSSTLQPCSSSNASMAVA